MQPSEPYFKSKRNLVLFGSVLLLIIFSGIEVKPGNYSIIGVTLSFTDTSFFDFIIAVIVFYYLIQISLFWSAQNEEIKGLLQYKVDFYISFLIGCVAIGSYVTIRILLTHLGEIIKLAEGVSATILAPILAVIISGITSLTFPIVHNIIRKNRLGKKESEVNIFEILSNQKWRLIFDPKRSARGHKTITFNADGNIEEGKNDNETSWRVRGEFLEILNSEGKVFSRFKYDKQKQKFFHTNDDDTRSLRSQRIEPLGEGNQGGS